MGQVQTQSGSEDKKNDSIMMLGAIEKTVTALAHLALLGATMEMIDQSTRFIDLVHELNDMLGVDFVHACINDEGCRRTMWDIVKTTRWWETEGEEWERKQRRVKTLKLLVEKLKEMKIELWCEEKDLGELGKMYEDCYVEFAGERFTVEEVHDAMTGIHVPWFNPFPEEGGGDGDQEG